MGGGGGVTPGFCIEHLQFLPYDSGEGRPPHPPPPPLYDGTMIPVWQAALTGSVKKITSLSDFSGLEGHCGISPFL